MSGIWGVIHRDGRPVQAAELQAMSAAIQHRGSDDQGIWLAGSVGLGHRMLWTTPESKGEALPLFTSAQQRVITSDLRLDNRPDLLDQLGLQHSTTSPIPDSVLVLAAYERWGLNCPQHLLGDFAFAIWDERQQQLFCARDHFGIKPFYFCATPHLFAFGSEIKALLALDGVPCQLNETRLADYFSLTLDDPQITSYQNIWRLPAAHTLTVSVHQAPTLSRYWTLERPETLHHSSDEAYVEEFLHHFSEAVRCRMRSAFPIGSHLSGGLDSSSVACMARQISHTEQHGPIHTLSHVYDDVPESDESDFIKVVLQQEGFIPHICRGDATGPLTEWQELFQYLDEALIGNGYLNWNINRLAGEHQVRVVLSGFDGDTTVGHGLNYLKELAQQQQWQAAISEATQFIQRSQGSNASAHQLIQRYTLSTLQQLARSRRWVAFAKGVDQLGPACRVSRKRLWYECGLKEMDGVRQLRQWRSHRRAVKGANPYPYLNPTWLNQIGFHDRARSLKMHHHPPQTVQESQWRAFTSALMILPVEVVDILSAAHGVETRHPFMDKRLVEYCLAVPPQQKLNQGWSRLIMRQAMTGILPPEIQWRGTKGDATAVFAHGVHQHDRTLLDELVYEDCQRLEPYINWPYVKQHYEKFMQGETEDIGELWFVITAALWLRQAKL